MKYSFSPKFRQEEYEACLEEIGAAIRQLAAETSCSVKTIRNELHIGAANAITEFHDIIGWMCVNVILFDRMPNRSASEQIGMYVLADATFAQIFP